VAGRLCEGTVSFASVHENRKGPTMDDATTNPSGDTFRKFAFVLMIALIGFGVLELANVIHI
jgi:hypothetical protein